MSNEPVTHVVGHLAADPELKFLPTGVAVCNVTVASTPKTFNRQTNEWTDGETLWMRGAVWREYAEHVAASLHKGDRVIMTGRLVSRSYDKDGEKRTSVEMQVDEIGPALRYADATVVKAERTQAPPSGGDQWATAPAAAPWGAPAGPAPAWGAPLQAPPQAPAQAPPQAPGGWGPQQGYSEPPF